MHIGYGDIAQLLTALAAITAVLVAWSNGKKIHNVHVDLNSRLTALLESTRAAAFLAGREREREQPGSNDLK